MNGLIKMRAYWQTDAAQARTGSAAQPVLSLTNSAALRVEGVNGERVPGIAAVTGCPSGCDARAPCQISMPVAKLSPPLLTVEALQTPPLPIEPMALSTTFLGRGDTPARISKLTPSDT